MVLLMRLFDRDNGFTRGGLDVVTAINLFFKGILLFPIFLLAGYIGVTMMKHMIFHGIPSMNRPTPEQIERLQQQDSEIGNPVVVAPEPKEVVEVVPEPPVMVKVVNEYEVYEDCMAKVSKDFQEQCYDYLP